MQGVFSYETTASLWFDGHSIIGHFTILACLLVLIYNDEIIAKKRAILQIMDLEEVSSSLCHVHEKELDTACLELSIHSDTSSGSRYELLGQSAECRGCPLQSILDSVVNGTIVKIDTRYGGVTKLRLIEHKTSR